MDHLARPYGNFGSEEYALEALSRKFAGRGLAAQGRSSSEKNTERKTAGGTGRQVASYYESVVRGSDHALTLEEFTQSYMARTMYRASNASRPQANAAPASASTVNAQAAQRRTDNMPAQRRVQAQTQSSARRSQPSHAAQGSAPEVRAVTAPRKSAHGGNALGTQPARKTAVRRAVEKRNERSEPVIIRNFRNLPVSLLATIVTCAMSLMLIVGTSVMMNGASNEYSDIQGEIATLAKQQNELQTALNIKNDLRMIEDIAVNKLGMVNKDLVTRQYIKLNDEDMIESFDSAEKNVGLSTLLSAIGGGK